MAKPVAVLYAAGGVPCVILAYGFFGATIQVIFGYFPYISLWSQITNAGAISFSCIPMFAMLFFAARLEWRRSDIDGVIFSFVVVAAVFLIAGAITAHAEKMNWWIGLTQIGVCLVGAFVADRRGKLRASNRKKGTEELSV